MTVEEFNNQFHVGQKVNLELDDGSMMETVLRSEAWELGHGAGVAKVNGKTGGWLIERIHALNEENNERKI